MPSTTVHLPADLLEKIDAFVRREKISRNRFITQACEIALKANAGVWPKNFFQFTDSDEERKLMADAVDEMCDAIFVNRRNRTGAAF